MKIVFYSKKEIRIALTGGGTGGHIFPLISIAREIKKELEEKKISSKFCFFGPDSLSLNLFKKENLQTKKITSGKINRFFDIKNLFSPFKIFIGFLQALWNLYFFMPDVLISKGGYGSVPVVLASWFYRIPIVVHESDSIPGLATRISSLFAKKIFISFKKSEEFFPKEKTFLVGNPTLYSNISLTDQDVIQKARSFFGFSKERPILLILGGSQGSQPLNDFVLNILPELISNGIQVIHQTGEKNFKEIREEAKIVLTDFLEEEKKLYYPVGFLDEETYKIAMLASDLVLSRAGAGTIFDLAVFAKPSILVPFPYASQNHQRANAYEYAKRGAALIIEQENLLPHLVVKEIIDLLKNKSKLEKMSEEARKFAKPGAGEEIAKEVLNIL